MKLWMIFAPMFAVGGLNVAYDAWKASPTSKTEQVRRQCIGMSKEKGIPAHVAVDACNCMVYEAKDWIGDHSVEEYTRDVHMKIGLQCYAKATEKAEASASSFGTFTTRPPARATPPLLARAGPGRRLQGQPPPLPQRPNTAIRITCSRGGGRQFLPSLFPRRREGRGTIRRMVEGHPNNSTTAPP